MRHLLKAYHINPGRKVISLVEATRRRYLVRNDPASRNIALMNEIDTALVVLADSPIDTKIKGSSHPAIAVAIKCGRKFPRMSLDTDAVPELLPW